MEKDNRKVSVARQCELLDLSKSSYYYNSVADDDYNLELMGLIDEQYTKAPFYGVRRMTAWLRARGYEVNPKRVRKLFQRMGFQAIYPHRRISFSSPGHKIYPYLLEGVKVERPDQVWGADITYIRLAHGFVYLVVVMDWYSRYVLSWELSNTLDSRFCVEALGKALWTSRPEIFNTDQGVQFSSQEFTGLLQDCEIKISMDGRGRVYDNIFVERLWRTVKYEEVYLHEYRAVSEVRQGLGNYFLFYNMERLHQSLGYRTPSIEIFFKILKQNLRVKTFVGTSANALKIQIWTSLIAILLLKYLKVRSQYNWSLSNLVALLRLNLFTYRDLWEWIDRPTEPPPLLQEAEQLALSFV